MSASVEKNEQTNDQGKLIVKTIKTTCPYCGVGCGIVAEVNAEKKLTRKVPTLSQIEDWVKQAADLPPKIEH